MTLARLVIALGILPILAGCSAVSDRLDTLAGKGGEEGRPFGAVAFSEETRSWAVVSDYATPLAASQAALTECGAPDCTILSGFNRGICTSFALDADRATSAPFLAASRVADQAKAVALASCAASGGTDCRASPPVCN